MTQPKSKSDSLSQLHPNLDTEALRCWAEIDLQAVRANAALLRKRAGGAPLLCVVKADGYGHGARAIVRALQSEANWFAVASVREAAQIADLLGPDDHILILGPALPAERPEIVANRFTPLVSSLEEALDYNRLAATAGISAFPLHVKIDTGMGRMGVLEANALEEVMAIHAVSNLEISGLATHLPAADSDPIAAREQLAKFGRLLQQLENAGLPRLPWHAQNSAGFLHNLESVGRAPGWVRPGLTLYGVSPTGEAQTELQRALAWKGHIVLVREMPADHGISYGSIYRTAEPTRVATISVGYADGYPRILGGRGASVLVGGRRCPILGRVTMDLIMVDIGALPETSAAAQVGAEVILLGRDAASGEEITAEELAEKSGTIPWEIFTNLSARVHRVYL